MSDLKDFKDLDMGQLCDRLSLCETAQYKIYADYNRAADMDETMRELKKEEKIIRSYMARKM